MEKLIKYKIEIGKNHNFFLLILITNKTFKTTGNII